MKNILLTLFTSCILVSYSQFTVTESTNATALAQQLAGIGVTISNATLVCPTSPFTGEAFSGTFEDADPSLGISDGVLLTTGIATSVNTPNGSNEFISEGTGLTTYNGDTDLDDLLVSLGETYTTKDACVLEFDINVIGDTLEFKYAMGSEEYPTFVCSNYNDIFGFFISGPNPAGGNYVNQNVALIPNTNIPVSINTVNNGGAGAGAATCYDGTYSNFMNSNTNPVSAVPNIAYNQITKTLTAKAATVPCAQYHFKLAIADGSDDAYDSGVFLEAGSFSSTGVIVSASTILGAGFNTMVEGCIDGELEFKLEDGINTTGNPIGIAYSFGGTATHLVDFAQVPFGDTLWIAPGDSSATLQLFTASDNVNEGVETIEVYIEGGCGSVLTSTMDISDVIPFDVKPYDNTLCIGQTIDFEVTGAQTYSWFPTTGVSNPNSGTVTLSPTTTTTYTVSYTLGSCSDDSTFTIFVSDLEAELFVTDETCPSDNDGEAYFTFTNGVGNVSYIWSDGNTDSLRTGLQTDNYCVTVSDQGGCDIEICDDIEQPNLEVFLFSFDNAICKGDSSSLEIFSILPTTATVAWSPANLVSDPTAPGFVTTSPLENTTTFTVTVTDQGCSVSDQITIDVSDLEVNLNITDVSCVGDTNGAIEVIATGTTNNLFYFWDNFENTSIISNLDTGVYCVEVTDFTCSKILCAEVKPAAPIDLNLTADDTVLCNENSTNIYINSTLENGSYTWSPAENFADANAANQNTAINLEGNTTITVTATNPNNCVVTEEITISAKKLEIDPDYSDTTIGSGNTIDIGVSIVFFDNLDENITFEWTPTDFLESTSDENTKTSPTENITYIITSEADGCIDIDSINVYVGIEFKMPEAFSPNGDGLNDTYNPVINGGEILEFRIYDRWGKMLHNKPEPWNGTYKNKPQGLEMYNYFIKVGNGNNSVSKLGVFSIVR